MRSLLVLALIVGSSGLGGPATAQVSRPLHPMGNGGYCGTVDTGEVVFDTDQPTARERAAPTTLFLNRCVGGCTITKGRHDAPNNISNNPGTGAGPFMFLEFPSFAGTRGAAADGEWNAIRACVAKIYSFYNVTVVDQRPTSGPYHMAIVSGNADSIQFQGGVDGQLLGLSALSCAGPLDNVVSFSLADSHRAVFESSARYVKEMCTTIAHEVGHAYGLEHQFEFDDGKSACPDPMSYDVGICNPPTHFFRNKSSKCGATQVGNCMCAQRQNSHGKLELAFGSKPSDAVALPTASVILPMAGQTLNAIVAAFAGSERGVEKVELILNGTVYAEVGAAPYTGQIGQSNPSQYQFDVPAGLPDSKYDIVIRAHDDVGNSTDSAPVSVMKGAGCTSDEGCGTAQVCDDGYCLFGPPKAIGATCATDLECESRLCTGTSETRICSTTCVATDANTCPDDLVCRVPANSVDPAAGVCFFEADEGGCCSTSSSRAPWGPMLLVAVFGAIAIVPRRRRRR